MEGQQAVYFLTVEEYLAFNCIKQIDILANQDIKYPKRFDARSMETMDNCGILDYNVNYIDIIQPVVEWSWNDVEYDGPLIVMIMIFIFMKYKIVIIKYMI